MLIENTVPAPKFASAHLPLSMMEMVDRIPTAWIVSKTTEGAIEVFDPENKKTTYFYRKVSFSYSPQTGYCVLGGAQALQGHTSRWAIVKAIKARLAAAKETTHE